MKDRPRRIGKILATGPASMGVNIPGHSAMVFDAATATEQTTDILCPSQASEELPGIGVIAEGLQPSPSILATSRYDPTPFK